MLIFDIETEENLQCGVTSNPKAKGGSQTSGFKSASAVVDAAIKKAIEDGKGGKTITVNAPVSRGAELRAKYGDIGKNWNTTGPDKLKIKLARDSRIRQLRQSMSEVRKLGLITRGEASDVQIQKSIDRKARKEGENISIKKQALYDITLKDKKDTFEKIFSGTLKKGGDKQRRDIGQLRKNPRSSLDLFLN